MLIGAGIGVPFRRPASATLQPPAFDAAASARELTVASSLTFAHTVGGGSNRILIVQVVWNGANNSVTGVTFNSVALTQLSGALVTGAGFSTGQQAGADLWYLLNPPAGTFNVVVTYAVGANFGGAGATSWSGVSQSVPFGTPATQAETTSQNPSLAVTTGANDVSIAVVHKEGFPNSSLASSDSDRWNQTDNVQLGSTADGASKASSGATTTQNWTGAASSPWIATGVAIKPG